MATSISSEEMAQIDEEKARIFAGTGKGYGLSERETGLLAKVQQALSMGVSPDVIENLIGPQLLSKIYAGQPQSPSNGNGSTSSGADVLRGMGISSLGDIENLRKYFEAKTYGDALAALDEDEVEDAIEELEEELKDIAELEENRFYKDATIRDSDIESETWGETISREPFGYVMPDEWIEGHEERMGVSPFDADPIKALVKRYIFGNYGHMPQSEYDAMVKQLTDLQSMQKTRATGYNQGGITSFRPMGAVPTGVGMPMHMPRPPRGQMPPQGMRRGGLTGQANKVAGAGRYGDTELVHMNPAEVQGLASLVPMTINPETGKPEAFLGLALGILGQALGGSAALGGIFSAMSPTVLGAIGSGIGSWAESGDLEKGILSGMLSFGVGSALDKIGSGAESFLGSGTPGVSPDPLVSGVEAATQAKTLNPDLTDAMLNRLAGKAEQGAIAGNIDAFQGLGFKDRVGHMGSNLLTKQGLSAFTDPMAVAPIAAGAGGLGAIRSEEQFRTMLEQMEEDKKRRRSEVFGKYPEQITRGVRERFGLSLGGV